MHVSPSVDTSWPSYEIKVSYQPMVSDTDKTPTSPVEQGSEEEWPSPQWTNPDASPATEDGWTSTANAGVKHGHPVPLTDLYIYEAGEPVNLEQIALIVSALADEADKLSREVLEIPHLAEFVEGLGRISPHCDEITKEAIAVMQDMWRARVLRLVINPPQPVPTWGDWLVTQPAPAINTAVNNGWLEVDQVGDHLLPFPVGPLHAPIATPSAMATPSGLPPALDVSLPELDETKRPYAAWMAYADKQLMVLAAARYIEQFPYLGMTLEKEPTLEKQARREAFQLIYEGGQINIEVGELFLSAFKKQKMFEEQTGGQKIVDSLGGPNAYAQSLIQNANDSDFEYYLSEGEDDTESDESGL